MQSVVLLMMIGEVFFLAFSASIYTDLVPILLPCYRGQLDFIIYVDSIDFSWFCLVVPGLLVMSLVIPFLLQSISWHSFSIPDLQCPLVSKKIFTDLLSMFPHVLACSQGGNYDFATPSRLSFTAFVFNFAATSSAIYFLSWSWFYHLHNLLSMFPFLHDFSFYNNWKIMMETL